MQYFVSIENTSYFYWQTELLIESFAMLGLESSLLVGIADNDSQKIGGFSTNIVRHVNKFVHPNEGKSRGYLPLNRVSSIRYALAYGALKFPFTLIHADMVLKNPVEDPDDSYPSVTLNNFEDAPMTDEELVKNELSHFVKKLAEDREIEEKEIPTVPFFSPPVVFNKPFESISDIFFSKLQTNMMEIADKKGPAFPCEKTAWELTLTESFQHCSVYGKFLAAPLLFDAENANFIHYRTGVPPVFHKKFFKYEDGAYLAGQGPYETLMEHNPSLGTDYVQSVVRAYADRRSKQVRRLPARQTYHATVDG